MTDQEFLDLAERLWLAAKAGGFHYRYDAAQGAWLDTKGAGEFFANLSRYATEQSGLALQFSAG
jgi:CyaY protein